MLNHPVGQMPIGCPVMGCYCPAFEFVNRPPPGFPVMSLDVSPPPGFQPRMVVANRPSYATNTTQGTTSDDMSHPLPGQGMYDKQI